MRIKIKLNLERLKPTENVMESTRIINKLLGTNNKWHGTSNKEYSVSMIQGGKFNDGYIEYNSDSHIFVSTNNKEILEDILSNIGKYEFEICQNNIRKGVNILNGWNIRYYSKGEDHYITETNKKSFEQYFKSKYNFDIEVLKINNNVPVKYKKSFIKSSNILFKAVTNNIEDLDKIFDLGVGCSAGIGFGFISNVGDKNK